MSTDVEEVKAPRPNVFGFFRYFIKFSPLNCSRANPIRLLFVFFTLIVLLSMLFRKFWMFAMTSGKTLTLAWSEKNMYGFITVESAFCVTGIYRITSSGFLADFERKIATLQSMRNKKNHMVHDNYRPLYIKLVILLLPIFPAYILAALYLAKHKLVVFGNFLDHNDWYYIVNFIVSIFCAYANVIFIPTYTLTNSAIRREFDVFNEELEESSKNKELSKLEIIQNYGERQRQLFELTHEVFDRYSKFMTFATFGMLIVVALSGHIVSSFLGHIYLFYYFTILAISIESVVMAYLIMMPPAMVYDSMLQTSKILLSEPTFQYSDDRMIYQTYRLMVDRSLHNKPVNNNVLLMFTLTKKNIERSMFICAWIVLLFSVGTTMLAAVAMPQKVMKPQH